ncbi:hypothetical protein HOI83_03665 [Candidatus Uhrbacteria bacterium]|jgi:hypothetical protein|nr:hypothetical protein [Candidatus Uhrbacteria bacterium]
MKKDKAAKRKRLGLILIIWPVPTLILTMIGFAIASSVVAGLLAGAESVPSSAAGVGQVINMLLGLLGVASILGIFISIPVGVYFLSTKPKS